MMQTNSRAARSARRAAEKARKRRLLLGLVGATAVLVFAAVGWFVLRGFPGTQEPVPVDPVVDQLPMSEPQSAEKQMNTIGELVNVGGKVGAQPVLGVQGHLEVASVKVETLIEGEGREIVLGTPVTAQVYRFTADGSAKGEGQFLIGMATEEEMGSEFAHLIEGKREGTRLLVIRPSGGQETEIAVVDILSTIATGDPVPDQETPLQVQFTDETPIINHGGEAPAKLTIQTLLKGDGPQVRSGDEVLLQHLMAQWGDGTVVSSSWADGMPRTHQIDDLWPGLKDALIDQRVGSRLAVTIPADQANGEDTIVAVIDILGTVHTQ